MKFLSVISGAGWELNASLHNDKEAGKKQVILQPPAVACFLFESISLINIDCIHTWFKHSRWWNTRIW